MTVDELSDFKVINNLITNIGNNSTWLEYAEYLDKNKNVKAFNEGIGRNEGYSKSINKENN